MSDLRPFERSCMVLLLGTTRFSVPVGVWPQEGDRVKF